MTSITIITAEQINKKHTPSIERIKKEVGSFWSKRNVQKLASFYDLWARDLANHQLNSLFVLEDFFATINQLLDCPKVKTDKNTDLKASLLTKQELNEMSTHFRTTMIHEVALREFKSRKTLTITTTEAQKVTEMFQASYNALNGSPYRFLEHDVHFAKLNLDEKEKLNQFDTALSEPENNSISNLKKIYESKIKILKEKKLSSMNVYLDWIFHLQSKRAPLDEKDKLFKELVEEESRVHTLAHQEYLNASSIYENLFNLANSTKSGISSIFKDKLRSNEMVIYDQALNKFMPVNISEHKVNDKEIQTTLDQIKNFFHLLCYNNKEAIALAKEAMGEQFSLSNAVQHLLKKIAEIESKQQQNSSTYKIKKISDTLFQELQILIASQINSAYTNAKKQSLKDSPSLPLDHYFKTDSSPHFYFKLAMDLEILHEVIPASIPEDIITGLVTSIQEEDTSDSELLLDLLPNDQNQKKAVELYKKIQQIRNKTCTHPSLKFGYARDQTSNYDSLKLLMENNIKNCILYLNQIDPSVLKEEDYLQKIQKITFEISEKFPNSLFYFDLALRTNHFNYNFQIDGETIEFSQEQLELVKQIITQYRVTVKKDISASKNQIPLINVVSVKPEVMGTDHETNARETQANKLRNTLTETLIFGLRFYHSQTSLLTTFLDWPNENLQQLFIDHLLQLKMIKDKKLAKAPPLIQFNLWKKSLSKIPKDIEEQATQLKKEFCSYLEKYRTVQREAYKFYTSLSRILIHNPKYLDLEVLEINDVTLLEETIDSVKVETGLYNDQDVKVAGHIKPYLAEIKKIISEIDPNEQSKALTAFFSQNKTAQGLPLNLDKVNVLNIKLLIQTIKTIELGKKINSINFMEFNKLFSSENSDWKKYATKTKEMTSSINEFKSFLADNKLNGFNPNSSFCPNQQNLIDYFQATQPFMIMIETPNTYFLKWPLYISDIDKRLEKGVVEDSLQAINQSSSDMNEGQRFRETLRARSTYGDLRKSMAKSYYETKETY